LEKFSEKVNVYSPANFSPMGVACEFLEVAGAYLHELFFISGQ